MTGSGVCQFRSQTMQAYCLCPPRETATASSMFSWAPLHDELTLPPTSGCIQNKQSCDSVLAAVWSNVCGQPCISYQTGQMFVFFNINLWIDEARQSFCGPAIYEAGLKEWKAHIKLRIPSEKEVDISGTRLFE